MNPERGGAGKILRISRQYLKNKHHDRFRNSKEEDCMNEKNIERGNAVAPVLIYIFLKEKGGRVNPRQPAG